jgi:hypothetical protein
MYAWVRVESRVAKHAAFASIKGSATVEHIGNPEVQLSKSCQLNPLK